MIRHVPLIRCQQRQPFCPGSRVEMYDDHLLAWMGHQYALRGAHEKPPRRGYMLTEWQKQEIRELRPTTKISLLAEMFGVGQSAISETCRGMNVRNVVDTKPVESADEWWRSSRAAGETLGVTGSQVRNCCLGYNAHVGGRRRTGTRVWYSEFATREAWAAAKQRKAVTA